MSSRSQRSPRLRSVPTALSARAVFACVFVAGWPIWRDRGCADGSHSREGEATCHLCNEDEGKTSDPNRTACSLCLPDFYKKPTSDGCAACPDGAACAETGTTVETMVILQGYWRACPRCVRVWPCPGPSACVGTAAGTGHDGGCRVGHEGAYCSVCAPDYYSTSTGCKSCARRGFLGSTITGAVLVLLVFVAAAVWYRLYVTNKARLQNDAPGEQAQALRNTAVRATELQKRICSFVTMLYGFVQMLTSIAPVYGVVWDNDFAKAIDFLGSVVFFNFFTLFPLECAIGRTTHHDKFDVYVAGYATEIFWRPNSGCMKNASSLKSCRQQNEVVR